MKLVYSLTVVFLFLLGHVHAQSNVSLTINHKLGEIDFALETEAVNNLDFNFNVTRLQYYISEISLIDDQGTETMVEDLWVLVDASTATEIDLGQFDMTSIDKIRLHIGVDPEHNHLDPSTYDRSHPLAPQAPSMHWGWTPGYRFVAYEGLAGPDLDQLFQLHGLGDDNYFTTEVDLDNVVAAGDKIEINLDADYIRGLENLEVKKGLVVHGERYEAKQCLENFRDYVFSQSSISSNTVQLQTDVDFALYPNPVVNGLSTVRLDTRNHSEVFDLKVTSMDGKIMIAEGDIKNGKVVDFSHLAAGMYLAELSHDGDLVSRSKVVIR